MDRLIDRAEGEMSTFPELIPEVDYLSAILGRLGITLPFPHFVPRQLEGFRIAAAQRRHIQLYIRL